MSGKERFPVLAVYAWEPGGRIDVTFTPHLTEDGKYAIAAAVARAIANDLGVGVEGALERIVTMATSASQVRSHPAPNPFGKPPDAP